MLFKNIVRSVLLCFFESSDQDWGLTPDLKKNDPRDWNSYERDCPLTLFISEGGYVLSLWIECLQRFLYQIIFTAVVQTFGFPYILVCSPHLQLLSSSTQGYILWAVIGVEEFMPLYIHAKSHSEIHFRKISLLVWQPLFDAAEPCSGEKTSVVPTACKCSLLQAEVEHLHGLIVKCLADQQKLQQETTRLSAQLQRFSRTEGTQQVSSRNLVMPH